MSPCNNRTTSGLFQVRQWTAHICILSVTIAGTGWSKPAKYPAELSPAPQNANPSVTADDIKVYQAFLAQVKVDLRRKPGDNDTPTKVLLVSTPGTVHIELLIKATKDPGRSVRTPAWEALKRAGGSRALLGNLLLS